MPTIPTDLREGAVKRHRFAGLATMLGLAAYHGIDNADEPSDFCGLEYAVGPVVYHDPDATPSMARRTERRRRIRAKASASKRRRGWR